MTEVIEVMDVDRVDVGGGSRRVGATTTRGVTRGVKTRSASNSQSDPSHHTNYTKQDARITNSHARPGGPNPNPVPTPNSPKTVVEAEEEEELPLPPPASTPRDSATSVESAGSGDDAEELEEEEEDARRDDESMNMNTDMGMDLTNSDGLGGHDRPEKKIIEPSELPNLATSDPAPPNIIVNAHDDDGDDGAEPKRSSSASTSPLPPASNGNTTAVDENTKKPASAVKPKSKRRSPSPESLPPPPPRVQKTIRLDISLGGPHNYAVDILQLAKGTGQRLPTPPPIKRDTDSSDSEGEGAGAAGDKDKDKISSKGKGRGKAGRKSTAAEYYDLNDPFIDDSELAIDERTFFAQTKQQGFYVSSGEVALLKDKSQPPRGGDRGSRERDGGEGGSPRKPKSKRNIVPTIIPLAGSQAANAAAASSSNTGLSIGGTRPPPSQGVTSPTDSFGPEPMSASIGQGTRETPITLSDTEENKSTIGPLSSVSTNGVITSTANGSTGVLKRKASENSTSGKKKRKTIDIDSFHPELQVALYELKDAISRESFEQKGKFPPNLKPILARVALKAIAVGEYNDNFFALMPKLFIYNKFTMTKLIKRTVYADHQKLLMARQDELLDELKVLADEGFEKAKEEYDKSVQAWERRQERMKAEGTSLEGTPVPGSNTPSVNGVPLPSLPPTQSNQADKDVGGADSSMEVDGPPLTQLGGTDKDKGGQGHVHSSQHMPIQRYRLTERMRNIIWELVVLSNESVRIENEKNTLENSTVQVSEQGTRKVLYQKVVAAFPEGWMSSGQISREVSVMKKRYEAQQAEGVS